MILERGESMRNSNKLIFLSSTVYLFDTRLGDGKAAKCSRGNGGEVDAFHIFLIGNARRDAFQLCRWRENPPREIKSIFFILRFAMKSSLASGAVHETLRFLIFICSRSR